MANRNWAPFPHAEYDEVIRYARDHDVDLIVVNGDEFEDTRHATGLSGRPGPGSAGIGIDQCLRKRREYHRHVSNRGVRDRRYHAYTASQSPQPARCDDQS